MSAADRVHPWPPDTTHLRLGELGVDLRLRRIERADGAVELPQRFFDLLLLFLSEPERLHSRRELLERVWVGVIVEDANLSQAVWTLRKALGIQRRDWIRTVAKSGYVFQPGVPVEVASTDRSVACLQAAAVDVSDGAGLPASQPATLEDLSSVACLQAAALVQASSAASREVVKGAGLPTSQPTVSRTWRHLGLLCLLLVAVAGWQFKRSAASSAPPPLLVSVMQIADRGASEAGRWPATVLRVWCEWQLSTLPELTLLPHDQLAVDARAQAQARVLMVSSGELPGRAGEWYVQARLELAQGAWQQRLTGRAEQMPALLEQLTAAVLAQLLPGRVPQAWPALTLRATVAADYAEFVSAREALKWEQAARLGRELVQANPGFGLLHLQLAQVVSVLGQVDEARRHGALAQRLLQPLRPPASEVLDAQLASLRREPMQALPRFAALARQFPDQPRFVLEHARALLAADRALDALALIDQRDWLVQPSSLRVAAWLTRAQALQQLGEAAAARASAQAALDLAQAADWPLEQGLARFQLAAAQVVEQREVVSGEGFLQAAALFERAGDHLRAQDARLHALGVAGGADANVDRELESLLAQARSAGHRGLEIDALRTVAFRYLRTGDWQMYRQRLEQAAAVAAASGDQLALARMDLFLLPLELDRGAYASVDTRLQRLALLPLQGESGFWTTQFAQTLDLRRGQYANAQQRLSDYRGRSGGRTGATVQALLACSQAQLHLVAGELSAARSEYRRCGDSPAPVYRLLGQLGQARVELFAGDHASAVQQLHAVLPQLEQLGSRTDQVGLRLELAELAVRAHLPELAQAQYTLLLPQLLANGQRVLVAEVHLGQARLAVAAGDWAGARQSAAAAAALAPAGDWQLAMPLQMLAALEHAQRGETESASTVLGGIARQARERGDRLAELELHSVLEALALELPCCPAQGRETLLAQSGLRGLRWALPLMALSPPAPAIAVAP